MNASRSFKLLFIGLSALGLAGLAAGLSHEPGGPEPATAEVIAPGRPPVITRTAVQHATGLSDAFIAIAETVTPAVVRIQAERRIPTTARGRQRMPGFDGLFDAPDDALPDIPQVAGGTGFIVANNGYILTNNHVIEDADRIVVTLRDRRTLPAQIIGRDPTTDVAVVKVDADNLPALRLGDSDSTRVGEWVIAVGNPGFDDANTLDFTVTSGIVSAKGRPLNVIPQGMRGSDPTLALFAIEDFIQTDAVINPGNSGGPLVDLNGAVIGVNTAIASTTGFNQGYGFAIPSNLTRRVMTDLIERGHVRRALLGVSILDVSAEDAEVYGLPSVSGVLVEDLSDDSPAGAAGVQRHDVVVAVNGEPVERVGELQRKIASQQPGESVRLSVVRYGEQREFQVQLAQAPLPEPPLPAQRETTDASGIGIEVAELTASMARRYGHDDAGGVMITGVRPAGPADRKRVRAGHRILAIDREPVENARQATSLLRAIRSGAVVSLLLGRPAGGTYIANVRVP